MRYLSLLLISMCAHWGCQTVKTIKTAQGQQAHLVWSDEFNYSGLPDSTKWGYDVGGHGWGNNEKQFYTSKNLKNARVENGFLVIEAHKDSLGDTPFSSARLVSKNKGDFQYVRVDVRAQLPSGLGTWPAIWMLPTDWKYGNWPRSGEIDIMEHVGYDPNVVHASVHTKSYNHNIGTQKTAKMALPSATTAFHVYSMEWYADRIDMFIDNKLYFSFKKESDDPNEWPFNEKFHILLNLAVGGNWGGQKGINEAVFPQKMLVDWVRVYEYAK